MNQTMQPTHCLQIPGLSKKANNAHITSHLLYLSYFPTKHSCNHLIKLHVKLKPTKIFILNGNKQDIIIVILLKQTINLINIQFFYIIM